MSKRNQHIEEWLRQAAAQDPEVSPDQVKQQAWGQLDQMLDKGAAVSRVPQSSGSGWWTIIVEALMLVGSFTYLQVGGNETAQSGADFIAVENALPDTKGSALDATINDDSIPLKLKPANDSITSSEKQRASNTFFYADVSQGPTDNGTNDSKQSVLKSANNDANGSTEDLYGSNAAKQSTFKPAIDNDNSLLRSATKTLLSSRNNKQPKNPSRQQNQQFIDGKSSNSASTPEAVQSLFTKQLFVPVKDSGLKNRPAPKTLRAHKPDSEPSPFSLRIAALIPISDAYGAAANIEYTFQWRKNWRVRPYLGAEYLTGFKRAYDHRSYSVSTNNTGGVGLYKTDSVLTHFTLQGMFYGKAGVQAVYVFPKWEIFAGIEYRYLLTAFGKDTFSKVSSGGNTIPADLQPVLFNTKQVTGSGNIRIQFGLDYMIKRRLQIGAIYYVQLNRQALDTTYRMPHPRMPDQTSFQIHARYFLRKR